MSYNKLILALLFFNLKLSCNIDIDGLNSLKLINLDKLILKKNNEQDKNELRVKMFNLCPKLKALKIKKVPIDLPYLDRKNKIKFLVCNPSIIRHNQGYYVNCKCVNFWTLGGAQYFSLIRGNNKTIVKNFLLNFDKNFNLISQKELISKTRVGDLDYDVLDDCRLFYFKNTLWFTCAWPSNSFFVQQVLFKVGDIKNLVDFVYVDKQAILASPLNKHEKNWLPIIINKELYLIYSYDPFMILKHDLNSGDYKIVREIDSNYDFSSFRGSAMPIKFDNGYLMLIHELSWLNGKRNYMHRFLYLDKYLKITKVSCPFIFVHKGIEFSISMVLDHDKKNLIIPIGIEDRSAKLCYYKLDYIRSLLRPI